MEENEALVRRYIDAVWNGADPDAAASFLDQGFRRHVSAAGAPLDVEGQLARLRGFRTAFPDATVAIDEVVAAGDAVVLRATLRGTHRGEFLGVALTGRRIEVALLDLIHVRDGRFVEHWGGPDLYDLVRQLGGVG